jgi:tight adherence protein B
MRLLTGLSSGLATYLVVGWLTGRLPEVRLPRRTSTRGAGQQRWLAQAGLALTPGQFWAASAALAAVIFWAASVATSTPAVAFVPAVAAGMAPRLYFARVRDRRMHAIQEAWPDGLREITAAIAAGMSLPQAVTAMARSGPEALREAFARFPFQHRVLGFVAALEVVRHELADPTSDRIIEVLVVAHQRGGRVVHELLRDLAEAATADVKTLDEIASADLEQKINARAVFVLPWLVLLSLTSRPGHFRSFYQSPGGIAVVTAAALLSVIGMWLVGRLSRDPAEQRVFAGTRPTSGPTRPTPAAQAEFPSGGAA